MPSLAGQLRLDDFGEDVTADYRAGKMVRVGNVETDSRTKAAFKAYEAIGAPRLGIGAPLLKDVPNSLTIFGQVVETGKPGLVDKRYTRPNGALFWASSALSCLDDEHGRPRAVLAVTVELTQRHQAEDALREGEAQHRFALQASRLGS